VLLDRFSDRFVHCPQELLGPFMLRRGEELLRRSLRDDLPLRKETYAVCELAFAGLCCVNIGYGHTEVADAIYEQAKKLAYYPTYVGHSTDIIIELSSRIIDWAPAGMKKVYYGMSGSDANETQIKLVWYYNNVKGRPNKKKIISRQRGCRGSGIVIGSLTGLPSFHRYFDLPLERVKHTVCPHWYRQAPAGMNEAQFVAYCVEELEKLIAQEGADTIAAFIG
jgi:L-2,4-diaminobutyrate transaminase